jgi:transmembrane sensor
MMPTDSELAGRALREHVAAENDTTSHAIERARLVTAATATDRRRWPILAAAVLSTAALAIALLLWQRSATTDSLTFTVGPDIRTGQVGLYYAATPDAELPLRFSDGSVVAIQPRGGVRVHQTAAQQVALFVETGRARFDVVHRPRAGWEIAAGPYSVSVTGTAFDLAWTPESRSLELVMRSGSVTVRGPGIENGVVVKDTERFVSRVTADVNRPQPPASPQEKAPPDPQARDDIKNHDDEPRGAEKPSSAKPPAEKSAVSWSELAAKGDYASIVRLAEERGIDQALAGASADELRALADAARFTGRHALAQRALLAIRTRFPGTKAATGAAFVLGRMLDGADARSAVTWYDRYIAEGGPMAAEAAGRRMLALRRAGDGDASRKAAVEYLRRFPDGPYAKQARELTR